MKTKQSKPVTEEPVSGESLQGMVKAMREDVDALAKQMRPTKNGPVTAEDFMRVVEHMIAPPKAKVTAGR